MEHYFLTVSIKDDEAKILLFFGGSIGSIQEYVKEVSELMLRIMDLSEKDAFFFFMDGLKLWVKQELERRGVQELSKALIVAESLIELVLKKDKFESSKPKRKDNGMKDEEG
ncbi:hypothetical protein J1N35_035397 [Gossypium stocksii]|uniref:Uncharacterized protein n=1 Tax=Gossypium stocksii TaxID=47602 RepID=A0A9D3UTX3_9ROSI|nr:hypothetical protein J1N35_035397 [Gossypium stocksii]